MIIIQAQVNAKFVEILTLYIQVHAYLKIVQLTIQQMLVYAYNVHEALNLHRTKLAN